MKLAEALMQRADAQRRIEQIKGRLLRNAKVQEGDQPAEDPGLLLAEVGQVADELVGLIQQINRTNMQARLEDGMSLADALVQRDVLRLRQGIYAQLVDAATIRQERYTRSEIRYVSVVNVPELQREADRLAKEARQLDAQIQAANWLVDMAA